MKNYLIVSNNPSVINEIEDYKILACEDLQRVMEQSRNLIHQGYLLITHPLAGSIKPVQNPYRSIILAENDQLDFDSLKIMEKALAKVKQFEENHIKKELPESICRDYQVIDFSLITSGLMSLK